MGVLGEAKELTNILVIFDVQLVAWLVEFE